ncbi:MAG: thioredoxin family protein [Flavobacteriales bacterium]|nr:thioredoxin family protein [Flavobacteriales bacterium]
MRLFKKYILLPLVALFLFVANANAQMEFPDDKVSWEFSIEQNGCDATIIAKITCVEHWHVYAANLPEGSFLLPTEIEPDKSSNYKVIGKVIEPKPEFYHDEAADEDIFQHSKTFTLKRKIKISSEKDFVLKGRFSFQTCDESHCLPPFDADFSLKIKGCGEEDGNVEGSVPTFGEVGMEDGDIEFPEDKVKWDFSIEQNGSDATIIAKITCIEGWHIYAANLPQNPFDQATRIDPEESSNYSVIGKVEEPKPEFYHDDGIDEDIYQHSKSFTLKRKIKVLSKEGFILKGKFGFITCDSSHCLPPFETDFEVEVKGTDGAVVEKDGDEDGDDNSRSVWTIFFLAFGSGLAALLTPCVFPMIPMTVSFFTKQSKSKAQGIRYAIFYGISIIVIYVILGGVVTGFVPPDVINEISTGVGMNIFFFILLVVFAVSFMGAFEITLPSSWVNKADKASDRGGFIGIFFMALVLALVSFSCTGPIVGTLLVESATIGGIVPIIGMFGFSLALALPFALFAAFPGWMNSLPKSGGWLTTVKVFLGFLELALAFKFLSNADLVVQGHYLERELFLAIWIGVFGVLAMYLFGFIQLPHDSPIANLSVGRVLLGVATVIFVVYLIPGLWGAPLKLISGFPPPMSYSESPHGVGGSAEGSSASEHGPEGTHLGAQSLYLFHDLDEGLAYAKKVGKPAFLDFTGWACVNCRKMEENVWGEAGVLDIMREEVVIISLYVDEKEELPEEEQIEVEYAPGKTRILRTIGNKWSTLQTTKYKTNTQPYYRMLGPNGEDLSNGSADYEHHGNKDDFKAWLDEGLKLYKEAK